MDFFQHQEAAKRKTGRLVLLFVLAVAAINLAVYLAFVLVVGYLNRHAQAPGLWQPDLLGVVSLGVLSTVTVGSLWKIAQLASGGEVVARAMGGQPVPANTQVLSERVLLNVVEEMAIAAGTPVPPVYLLDGETAINAFAAGTTPQNAVIGVTRGCVETLSRDELQGVIAHEFSHILNGDMRLNLRLIGILNGILLIAMIGLFLMRTGVIRSNFSSSSNSSGGRGGNPLPLLGFCLYIIGFVGVFFGRLIKSGVSRQREYLADASAVQFTRYPGGIGGALKKIGGLLTGSRLQTSNAEEASHMFFGNALSQSFLQMLSTHPPLDERIRRIEPDFNGEFPKTRPIQRVAEEIVDPQTLARRRVAPEAVHDRAEAAVQSFAASPADVVASVGTVGNEHLDYAADLIGSLPSDLTREVHEPLGAVAIIYAMLLDDEAPEVRQRQVEYLSKKADRRAYVETQRVAAAVSKLHAEVRLPIVQMTLPALKQLSRDQVAGFRADVDQLIRADTKMTLFEYAVDRLVLKRLMPQLDRNAGSPARTASESSLLAARRNLLSTLAYAGGDVAQAAQAFAAAIKLFGDGARIEMLPRDQCSLQTLDAALDQLSGATMGVKKRLLEACATCISADGRMTVQEGELLRVIADALDCPMPPLVGVAE